MIIWIFCGSFLAYKYLFISLLVIKRDNSSTLNFYL